MEKRELPLPENIDDITNTALRLAKEVYEEKLTNSKAKAIAPFLSIAVRSIYTKWQAQKDSGCEVDMSWFESNTNVTKET